jgi:Protein of unknown function (DUF5661)
MESTKQFTTEQARQIGDQLGIDWNRVDLEQFRMGLEVELEHGKIFAMTNVTDDNELQTGKIALAHLMEFPDYYSRLKELEADAEAYWAQKRTAATR